MTQPNFGFSFLCSVDDRYEALLQAAAIRRQKLLDALSLHQLNRDAYIVESWINEKVCYCPVCFYMYPITLPTWNSDYV